MMKIMCEQTVSLKWLMTLFHPDHLITPNHFFLFRFVSLFPTPRRSLTDCDCIVCGDV
jgi:hypothetical protein